MGLEMEIAVIEIPNMPGKYMCASALARKHAHARTRARTHTRTDTFGDKQPPQGALL